MTHRDVIAIPDADSYPAIPTFGQRVGRIVTQHIHVTELLSDFVSKTTEVADCFCIVDGPSAGRGNVLHEVAAATSSASRPRLNCRRTGGRCDSEWAPASRHRPRERKRKWQTRNLVSWPGIYTNASSSAAPRVTESIHKNIRFGDHIDGVIIAGSAAGRIVSIGKQYQRFSPFNVAQLAIDRFVDSVINTGSTAHVRPAYRPLELATVAGEIAQVMYVAIEGDHHHAILFAQLPDKSDGGVLNVFYAPGYAWADVKEEDDVERNLLAAE